jgi:hypothetical protein
LREKVSDPVVNVLAFAPVSTRGAVKLWMIVADAFGLPGPLNTPKPSP